MNRSLRNTLCLALPLLALNATPSHAWWPEGHSMIAQSAVEVLPAELPSWFRKGKAQIAHCAQDPDVQKSRDLPMMTEAEYPQHFIDMEMLKGNPLPKTRKEFYKLCATLNVDPSEVGELPYAITEWTQRLTMTFAEARQYPKNKEIQTKALVYAGILSHYSGDATMPLHTTVDYDGRLGADGKSPKSGIHAKVDSLIEKVNPKQQAAAPVLPFNDLWGGIEAELKASQAHIDQTYSLESQFPGDKDLPPAWKPSPEVETYSPS